MDASELVKAYRVVPVVAIDNPDLAVPLAEALLGAGIGIIEITLRTATAMKSIENVIKQVPDMLVGVGSIRHARQLAEVANAGAKFAVSPGHSAALLEAATAARLPFIPGAATPSEMLGLLAAGYTLQKLFPAEVVGGIAMLKSVAGPIPEVRFMPTGGISEDMAGAYLALSNVACVGGSWIAPGALIEARDFVGIGKRAAAAARLGT